MYVICRLYCFVVRRVTGIATGLRCTPPSFRLQINTFQYFSLFKCVFCSTAKGEEADPACSIVCAWYHTHQMLQHCRFPRGESAGSRQLISHPGNIQAVIYCKLLPSYAHPREVSGLSPTSYSTTDLVSVLRYAYMLHPLYFASKIYCSFSTRPIASGRRPKETI